MVDIDPVESCGVAEAKIRDLYLPVGVYFMATMADAIDERVLIEAEKVTSLGEEVEVASFVMGILQELGGRAETSCIRQVGEREEAASVLSFVGDEVAVSREVGTRVDWSSASMISVPSCSTMSFIPRTRRGSCWPDRAGVFSRMNWRIRSLSASEMRIFAGSFAIVLGRKSSPL